MTDDVYPDELIRTLLLEAKTIAVVGASPQRDRPSNEVMAFLISVGYRILPVNPRLAGQKIHGIQVFGRLAEISEPVDIIDVFRRSEGIREVIDEVLGMTPLPMTIWMQLGVSDDASAERARSRGLTVIQNRCPKIEFARLSLTGRAT